MTYLDIARAAVPACEKSEISEKSSELPHAEAALALRERIIAAVTVDPERFDRAAYDALWQQWDALEGAP